MVFDSHRASRPEDAQFHKDGPSALIETILPSTYRGRQTWRVVHRDADPTADGEVNAYDLYDVTADTLVPLRSVMNREGFHLSLSFEGDHVIIEKEEGGRRTRSEVQVQDPMPEGPGFSALVAALPLRPGFQRSFQIVDRWASEDSVRVKWTDLTVAKSEPRVTPLGRCDAYEVLIAPRDGSFRIRHWRTRGAAKLSAADRVHPRRAGPGQRGDTRDHLRPAPVLRSLRAIPNAE